MTTKKSEDKIKQIIIAQRGWVFYGDVTRRGTQIVIDDAFTVRRWGTTAGLGQIAIHGPTDETILDFTGTVSLHELTVVAAIICNPESWTFDKVMLSTSQVL